jgi:hypothetical protein
MKRDLVTSAGMALSSVRLQPNSYQQRGGFSSIRTNARERRAQVAFGAANAPVIVYHGLGFPPSAAMQMGANAACKLYHDLPLPSTSRVLVLKCDTANVTVDILVR